MSEIVELVCPAGSLPALRAAVDNGADAVYMGFRDATNARNFPGMNFDEKAARKGIDYAHERGSRVFAALNTYPQPDRWDEWTRAVDLAVDLGVDALILADAGLMRYASRRHPSMRLHLSVQGSATSPEAVAFYRDRFAVERVILPRVLSVSQVRSFVERSDCEAEVFGFGSLCVMVEGRCALSSFVTGDSPNTQGVCSPAHAVRWEESDGRRSCRLNGVLVDEYSESENSAYPTICKGRYEVAGRGLDYAIEEPTSLSVLDVLPELVRAGVRAIKVEGRQRSPAYVAAVTGILRQALDRCLADPDGYAVEPRWQQGLMRVSEGQTHTLGALDRGWQ